MTVATAATAATAGVGAGSGSGRPSFQEEPGQAQEPRRASAEQAIEKGEAIVIRQELNSYERRIVHVAIQDMEGVSSESIGDGSVKQIRLVPDGYEE